MKFLKWLLGLLRRKKQIDLIVDEKPKLTSGKNHVWVKRSYGWVRKPKGRENESGKNYY